MDEQTADRAGAATMNALARLTIENQILREDNAALVAANRRQGEMIQSLQDLADRLTKQRQEEDGDDTRTTDEPRAEEEETPDAA